MLMSRDEQSCLVVSYRDLKTCIEAAFKYVPASQSPSSPPLHNPDFTSFLQRSGARHLSVTSLLAVF